MGQWVGAWSGGGVPGQAGSRDTHPLGASPPQGMGNQQQLRSERPWELSLHSLPQLWAQATPASPPAWGPSRQSPVGRSWAPRRSGMEDLLAVPGKAPGDVMILGPPAGISSPT